MEKDIGRIVTRALRHDPEMLDLTLDKAGYCLVAELVDSLNRHGFAVDAQTIEKLGENERFGFSADHTKFRADYGNSIGLKLCDMYPQDSVPPEILYHGTAREFLDGIREKGILRLGVNGKKGRDHVFMTKSPQVAMKKGKRHGQGIVLPVRAREMYEDGYLFYHAKNEIWLTDHIPAQYINQELESLPDAEDEKIKRI
jgi:putative RNA 2'-phosphotransferase